MAPRYRQLAAENLAKRKSLRLAIENIDKELAEASSQVHHSVLASALGFGTCTVPMEQSVVRNFHFGAILSISANWRGTAVPFPGRFV